MKKKVKNGNRYCPICKHKLYKMVDQNLKLKDDIVKIATSTLI